MFCKGKLTQLMRSNFTEENYLIKYYYKILHMVLIATVALLKKASKSIGTIATHFLTNERFTALKKKSIFLKNV